MERQKVEVPALGFGIDEYEYWLCSPSCSSQALPLHSLHRYTSECSGRNCGPGGSKLAGQLWVTDSLQYKDNSQID